MTTPCALRPTFCRFHGLTEDRSGLHSLASPPRILVESVVLDIAQRRCPRIHDPSVPTERASMRARSRVVESGAVGYGSQRRATSDGFGQHPHV